MFGVLNIDKPLHHTSHDVVARLRRIFNLKKIGHAGTLDPLASGVLPVCVGSATRLIEYFPSDKRYEARICFGKTSHTWDAEGPFMDEQDASHLTRELVEAELITFQGNIQQQVPPHAAVHVNGKKLYEYARKGIVVELPVRAAEIYAIALTDWDASQLEAPVATIAVHCGSGTYIRSIAQALGHATGTGAYLSGLVRTAHGQMDLTTSVSLETLQETANPQLYLQNPLLYVTPEQVEITESEWQRIANGQKLNLDELSQPIRAHKTVILTYRGWPAAIALAEETGRLKPLKVFSDLHQVLPA